MAGRPGPGTSEPVLPPIDDIQRLASDLLGAEGTRLAHVRTAGWVASRLAMLVPTEDADLLVAAANLHDIGYSARIAHTGFHPLDGARFLVAEGFPRRLAGLVANHSLAHLHADPAESAALAEEFPREESMVSHALAYADMHSAPDGRLIAVEHRLADIAARHADPRQTLRASQLRIVMARVGAALLESDGEPRGAAARRGRWIDRHAWSVPAPVGTVPVQSDADDPVARSFRAWLEAEARYDEELSSFDAGSGRDRRTAALELARLRAAADSQRDGYFRRALQHDLPGQPREVS